MTATTHYRIDYPTVTIRTTNAARADAESRAGARVSAVTVGDS